jgi:mono/diheme cytochrome c family protein
VITGERAVICLASLAFACALAANGTHSAQKGGATTTKPAGATATSDGEKAFRTNCGRCHNPPEDLSPREARAVVHQMSVRGMLSVKDEKLILDYLAP